jgi:hypothetical protein
MSTKTTHVLSKEEIVSKLENLHFSFEEHHWESFLQKFDEVNVHQVTTSTAKFSPKLIAIPACIVLAGIIVYFSVNKLQSQNNASDPKVKIETASTAPATQAAGPKQEAVKKEAVPDIKASAPVATVDTKATVPTPQQSTAKSIQPTVVTSPVNKANTTASVPSNMAKQSSLTAQTQGAPLQQQAVKKFYKKKTDTQTTPQHLVPSPGEDDVVVPDGESGTSTPEN